MPDFGIFRGFNEKLFGDKLYAGQLPTQLGIIGSQQVTDFIGLVDIYPNAAAAYSLRLLRLTYTGSAIKVRRASDNTEQDIGFVDNELDVATLESFCSGTSGFVTTWYDQSGNGRDATQSTALSQSQIVSSGSVILENGNPILIGDGNNCYFIALAFNTNYRTFAVLKNAGFSALFGSNNSADATLLAQSERTTAAYLTTATVNAIRINTNPVTTITRGNIFTLTTNQALLFDNVDYNFTGINSILGYNNGGSGIANYSLQELIIYPSSQTNITDIESNINDFYSIY
jgi:hypothetical protein